MGDALVDFQLIYERTFHRDVEIALRSLNAHHFRSFFYNSAKHDNNKYEKNKHPAVSTLPRGGNRVCKIRQKEGYCKKKLKES